jgi:hypothetical protein
MLPGIDPHGGAVLFLLSRAGDRRHRRISSSIRKGRPARRAPPTNRASTSAAITAAVSGAVIQGCCLGSILMAGV